MNPPSLDAPAILVVEDEESVRRYIARIFADAGYPVLLAADGVEAWTLVETLGTGPLGLVVSDVSMPRMTGTELAVRLAGRWPTLPVLLVSALNRPADCRGAFLQKPFPPDQLLAAVRELFRAGDRVAAGG